MLELMPLMMLVKVVLTTSLLLLAPRSTMVQSLQIGRQLQVQPMQVLQHWFPSLKVLTSMFQLLVVLTASLSMETTLPVLVRFLLGVVKLIFSTDKLVTTQSLVVTVPIRSQVVLV